jgi:response regulator RpfG family c-di-GMP phosphodiesterase
MSKPTLLYVDDEPINLTLFELNFKDKFNVVSAESGSSALEIARNNPEIKAVISDMRMPEMDGLEFIQLFRSESGEQIPCFILTAFQESPEISEALENQVIMDYFKKPMNRELIELKLNKHLKN